LIYATDDAKLVRKEIKGGLLGPRFVPDARLAFIGGEPLIGFYAKAWSKVRDSKDLLFVLDSFGRMRSASVHRMMEQVSVRSTAGKSHATVWLEKHR
jgi:hypothetical protein